MNVMLGNLTIEDMEKRLGVEFQPDLKKRLAASHQQKACPVQPGHWHCFDTPFTLVCGDFATASMIHNYLLSLSKKMRAQLQIEIQKGE